MMVSFRTNLGLQVRAGVRARVRWSRLCQRLRSPEIVFLRLGWVRRSFNLKYLRNVAIFSQGLLKYTCFFFNYFEFESPYIGIRRYWRNTQKLNVLLNDETTLKCNSNPSNSDLLPGSVFSLFQRMAPKKAIFCPFFLSKMKYLSPVELLQLNYL